MNLKFLSIVIGILVTFIGTPAWAGGSAAIVLEGPEFNAEAELAIRDALAPSGLTIESRDTIEAARAFASSGDTGWNEASLQSLRGAIGCNLLLVFEQKVIGGEKYALRAHIAFEGGVGSKVMSTEKANLHKALAKLTTDALGEVPRTTPNAVPTEALKPGVIGVQVQFLANPLTSQPELTVTQVFHDTPAMRAGVLPGDRVVQINNWPTANLTPMQVVGRLRGTPGTDVTVYILRAGWAAPRPVTLTRMDARSAIAAPGAYGTTTTPITAPARTPQRVARIAPTPSRPPPKPRPVATSSTQDDGGFFLGGSVSLAVFVSDAPNYGDIIPVQVNLWLVGGMQEGIGLGLKSFKSLEGGDFVHQAYLGYIGDPSDFFGIMLVGSHEQDISKSLNIAYEAMMMFSDAVGLNLGFGYSYYYDAESHGGYMSLGLCFTN